MRCSGNLEDSHHEKLNVAIMLFTYSGLVLPKTDRGRCVAAKSNSPV